MERKDLEKQKALLLKEIEAEQKKLKAAEHKLSLYEYEELEKKEKEAKKPAPKKKTAKKKPAKKTTVKSKPSKKDEGANRKNMKKHVIVPASELNNYDFEQRKNDWHAKSGMNEKQEICSICGDDDNWESILLDNKKHVCYYCWIKKPENLEEKDSKKDKKAKKEKESRKDKKAKKEEAKNAKAIESKKDSTKDSQVNEESKPVGKLFYIIAITLGILLIALIIIIVLGIISGWSFKF